MHRTLGRRVNDLLASLLALQHRLDPLYRNAFDAVLQRPLVAAVQAAIRLLHPSRETRPCQEIVLPDEERATTAITTAMARFLERTYRGGAVAERAGNTKTYGVVRAVVEIRSDVPPDLRRGVFATPARYPAWIRFGGPGPLSPPDVRDAGILSIGVKLMGVPGPKLLDEQRTQDFLGISCPTFTTPDVIQNLDLQRHIGAGTPTLYFLQPRHWLDALMQGLYARLNTSPLEVRYWSCVPFLCGEGLAVKYAIRPLSRERTRIPWPRIPDDWLRQSMAATLARRGVELELALQRQGDPRRFPVENAAVAWPERRSPFVPVARITIPAQRFDSPEQLAFARRLAMNPWHCVPEHRPLGNQNRARRVIYAELSRLRQAMNAEPLLEPDGTEAFPGSPPLEPLAPAAALAANAAAPLPASNTPTPTERRGRA